MRKFLSEFLERADYNLSGQDYVLGNVVPFFEFRSGAAPQEKGVATCWCENNELHAAGLFYDSELFNNSIIDNDLTWEKGDVFEFIFQKPNQVDYYEFHSTPEGKKLEYHIIDAAKIKEIPHEQKICDCNLQVKNSYQDNLWYSELIVPFSKLGIDSLDNCKCVFIRQNYKKPNIKFEITSSQVFPITVHAPQFWHRIKAEKQRS